MTVGCKYDCVYKKIALADKAKLEELIEQDEPRALRDEEAARKGWGNNGGRRMQDTRHEDIDKIYQILEIDGLLCDDLVCGLALESVRARLEATSNEIKTRREQM